MLNLDKDHRKYLALVDIKLNLNNKAPDETIPITEGLMRTEACGKG